MCDCNIRYLIEGTRELVKYNNEKFGLYITCSCDNYEEFFHNNFITCANCKKNYCYKCKHDLIYEIHNYTICCCLNSTKYYNCCDHYYCDNCKLPDCDECTDHNNSNNSNSNDSNYNYADFDKCPKCNIIYAWDDKLLCEIHYELKNLCD